MSASKQLISRILPAVLLLSLIGSASAQDTTVSETLRPSSVRRVATALNHVTIIQFPEPVLSASVGSDLVRMEWHDNRVLVQPLRANVDTNLTVWTANTRTTYEIQPAGKASEMTYVIDEVLPAPAPPPPEPSPVEVRRSTDRTLSSALMNLRIIDSHKIKNSKKTATIRVKEVTEDSTAYYVHLSAFNRGKLPYRLTEPTVAAIRPAFAEKIPEKYLRKQIKTTTLEKFGVYQSGTLSTHGSTLETRDLAPGDYYEWVVAIGKTGREPGIYLFNFESQKYPVYAITLF
jgi:hypothetical protein